MGSGIWVAAGFFLVGIVLAVTTTTSNRWRWAVWAPLAFGTGALVLIVIERVWGAIALAVGMYYYAALNFRNFRRAEAAAARDQSSDVTER